MYSIVMASGQSKDLKPSSAAVWHNQQFLSLYGVFIILVGYQGNNFIYLFWNIVSDEGTWRKWTNTENSDQ